MEEDYLNAGRAIRNKGLETGQNNYGFVGRYATQATTKGEHTLSFTPQFEKEIGMPPPPISTKKEPKKYIAYNKGLLGG